MSERGMATSVTPALLPVTTPRSRRREKAVSVDGNEVHVVHEVLMTTPLSHRVDRLCARRMDPQTAGIYGSAGPPLAPDLR
jgi:hypothetical protein